MVAPISPIGYIPQLGGTGPVAATSRAGLGHAAPGTAIATGTTGPDFASALAKGLDQVQAAQNDANQLAVQAAAGELVDPAQLTIATTKAQLMTQLAVTVQSKAIQAFNTIMSMQA